ncbi:MAG: prevent-host-death protein [Thiothrix lacustris]|uniref:Antitoxin n=1 Tax=Thiothrix lacustris TaxID=525917 RepID=A0A1Y1QMS2_9GAMM|nr:MAG: prevent-host-death protein [Thiothrix lacustris]
MQVVTFTEARNNLKTILNQVIEDADCILITRDDAEDTVVMSLDYYYNLMETLHLLKTPANAAHLQKSIKQFHQGKTTNT